MFKIGIVLASTGASKLTGVPNKPRSISEVIHVGPIKPSSKYGGPIRVSGPTVRLTVPTQLPIIKNVS